MRYISGFSCTESNHITSHFIQKYSYYCFCHHKTWKKRFKYMYLICRKYWVWRVSAVLPSTDSRPVDRFQSVKRSRVPVNTAKANSRVKPSHDPDNMNQTGSVTNSHPSPPAAPRPPGFWQDPRTRPPTSKEGAPVSHHSRLSHPSKLFRGCQARVYIRIQSVHMEHCNIVPVLKWIPMWVYISELMKALPKFKKWLHANFSWQHVGLLWQCCLMTQHHPLAFQFHV